MVERGGVTAAGGKPYASELVDPRRPARRLVAAALATLCLVCGCGQNAPARWVSPSSPASTGSAGSPEPTSNPTVAVSPPPTPRGSTKPTTDALAPVVNHGPRTGH